MQWFVDTIVFIVAIRLPSLKWFVANVRPGAWSICAPHCDRLLRPRLIETDERGARAECGDDGRAAQRSLGAGALRKDRRREDRQVADTALDAAQ